MSKYDYCKYCKYLVCAIVEPTDKQICGLHHKTIEKTQDKCKDYQFKESSVKTWENIDKGVQELIEDDNSDYNRSKYDVF